MGKRVGTTENISRRKTEWLSEQQGLHNWVTRASNLSYEQAKALEKKYIAMGYEGSPGGPRKEGYIYSVYTFEY